MRVFVMLDYYLPGYKSGGPLRTISNMVGRMADQLEFWIFTRDRDLGDPEPYPNVQVNAWQKWGLAQVFYSSPGFLTPWSLRRLLRETQPQVVYLNSFFSIHTILYLVGRKLRLYPNNPVVLAPRGELSPDALNLGAFKKRAYISATKLLGLVSDIHWQGSALKEEQEIKCVFGARTPVKVAPDLSAVFDPSRLEKNRPIKQTGRASFVFLSRISPMKNLAFAIKMLGTMKGEVVLDIYGPQEDLDYWTSCEGLASNLPAEVQVAYKGSVPHENTVETLSHYHFFLLPTLGENFGHVIMEAASAACVLLISDRTPWRDLETKHIGWDLPLESPLQWQNALQECVDMDESRYRQLSSQAQTFAQEWVANPDILKQNAELFRCL